MSLKCVCPAALFVMLLGLGSASAQYPTAPLYDAGQPPDSTTVEDATPVTSSATKPHLSSWMSTENEECCGPLGQHGPIFTEIYERTGVSLPVYGPIFGRTLGTGLVMEAGANAHFFNLDLDRAWLAGLGLTDIYNHGQHKDIKAKLERILVLNPSGVATRIRSLDVSIGAYNRTFFDLMFGREWYLYGCPIAKDGCGCNDGVNWRIGVEAIGHYGTAKLSLNELPHRTAVIGGAGLALNSDVEFPCGKCCTFIVGFRTEWEYIWGDILQHQNNADVADVNFLLTLGVRF